jgi:hypothetical protein
MKEVPVTIGVALVIATSAKQLAHQRARESAGCAGYYNRPTGLARFQGGGKNTPWWSETRGGISATFACMYSRRGVVGQKQGLL